MNYQETPLFSSRRIRFGGVPGLGNYDFIYNNPMAPNQQITIPATQAGWYYIMVRGGNQPNGPLGYALTANTVPFTITSVTPTHIGDNGQVTITVNGSQFQPGASVQLVSGTNTYVAGTNFFDSATSVRARFFFTNAVHGTYDVVLNNPGNQNATATQAVTIETALPLTPQIVPGLVNYLPRAGTPFRWIGSVVNLGNIDIQYFSVGLALDQPFPFTLSPPIGALRTDTNSTDNSENVCDFLIRNLSPGESLDFSFQVSGFGSQGFVYYLTKLAQTKSDLLNQIASEAQSMRKSLLTTPTNTQTLSPEMITALEDPNLWQIFYADYFVADGLLDPADLAEFPLSTSSIQATSTIPITTTAVPRQTIPLFLGPCAYCYANGSGAGSCDDTVLQCVCICEGTSGSQLDSCVSRKKAENHCPPPCVGPNCNPNCGTEGHPCPPIPHDPNYKQGQAGYGAPAFDGSQVPWLYTIYFENESNATAFARQVSITDPLDPSVDIRSFRVGNIVIGNKTITVPTNSTYFQTRIALPPPNPPNVVADITAGVDVQNHSLFWTMNAIDLNTGQLVTGAQEGVLPPNTTNNIGAGYVTFSIQPAAGVPTGTVVTNQATIVFDINDPIPTDTTTNTVDAVPPTSIVATLPSVTSSNTFTVYWGGSDDAGGSGIASFNIYFSDDGGPYQLWQAGTTFNSAQFTGQFGHTYAFYSTAQDNAGNVESVHTTPDTTTLVSSPPVIAPVSDETINPGGSISITNLVSDADQPAPTLTFSLGPNAPVGASINPTNGVFTWTPECAQGSTTNLIQILVTASDDPSVSNSILFNIIVADCVQVGVGSTIVQTGQSASIPVNLFTTVGLTNLSFTLIYPADRFTNWTIVATNPVGSTGLVETLGPSNTSFAVTTPVGQPLQGPTVAGSLTFSALPGDSAFVPLSVTGVAGTKADGSPAGNISGVPGRVVIIGPKPLLEAGLGSNSTRILTLYGNPGTNYQFLISTNLLSTNWQAGTNVTLTNLFEYFNADSSAPLIFYRAH